MLSGDNLTSIILSFMSLLFGIITLVVSSILHNKVKKNTESIATLEATRVASPDEVGALMASAQKVLEVNNKILKKHGRMVQAAATEQEKLIESAAPPIANQVRRNGLAPSFGKRN